MSFFFFFPRPPGRSSKWFPYDRPITTSLVHDEPPLLFCDRGSVRWDRFYVCVYSSKSYQTGRDSTKERASSNTTTHTCFTSQFGRDCSPLPKPSVNYLRINPHLKEGEDKNEREESHGKSDLKRSMTSSTTLGPHLSNGIVVVAL